jgi:predicted acylesterase/phospholipase RssA
VQLIWSAACASCAFPGLYEPVPLMMKDELGNVREYAQHGMDCSIRLYFVFSSLLTRSFVLLMYLEQA